MLRGYRALHGAARSSADATCEFGITLSCWRARYGLQSEGQLQVFSPGPQLPLPQRVHRCAVGAVEMHCPPRGSSASAWTRSGQQCENDLADAMPPSGTQVSETGAQAPLACSTKPGWQSHR